MEEIGIVEFEAMLDTLSKHDGDTAIALRAELDDYNVPYGMLESVSVWLDSLGRLDSLSMPRPARSI